MPPPDTAAADNAVVDATVTAAVASVAAPPRLPRVTIQFCTQCKWMLRAAYFAQELMSTFGLALGEVALQPATGGVFTVTIETEALATPTTTTTLLWDRKSMGGFPETKELKRRVRDVIAPGRDLGHVDRHDKAAVADTAPVTASTPAAPAATPTAPSIAGEATGPVCEDCK